MRRTAVAALLALTSAAAPAENADGGPTDKEIRLFTMLYHDALTTVTEIVGQPLLALPLGQFAALTRTEGHTACPAIVDGATYRAFFLKAIHATHPKEAVLELMKRSKKLGGFRFRDLNERYEQIVEKATYCLESGVLPIGSIGFTAAYMDTQTEFTLRDIYQSQIPVIRWARRGVPPGKVRVDLDIVIRSMEEKYLLKIEANQ